VFRYVAKPWSAAELEKVFAQAFTRREQALDARRLAEESARPALSPQAREAERLEAEEPGITRVRRDSDGSVIM
jgi:hypothetical protein